MMSPIYGKDAPVLPARRVKSKFGSCWYRAVWCKYCKKEHLHGDVDGHRVAHCMRPDSPYWETGYYVKLGSEAERFVKRGQKFATFNWRRAK